MATTNTNPLADVLRPRRADLAGVVNTLSISVETQSDVTEYPVESGASVADHSTSMPTRISITGRVRDNALGGTGAREVEQEFMALQASGARVDVPTPREVWTDCVVTRVRSNITASNLRALEFEVEFTQVQVVEVGVLESEPILDEFVNDTEFKDAAESEGIDATTQVTVEDPLVAKVQSVVLSRDADVNVRRQFARLSQQGIDPDTLGFYKAEEYAREIIEQSRLMWTAQQDVNPLFVLGGNTWEIDLPSLSEVQAQQTQPQQRVGRQNFAGVANPRPTKFTIDTTLRDRNRGVFKIQLRFRWEFLQTGAPSPIVLGTAATESLGTWYLTIRASRDVNPLGISFIRLSNPLSGVAHDNIRIKPSTPMVLGDGRDFGLLYALPRFATAGADTAIRGYDAFVGLGARPSTFQLLHVNDPDALSPITTDPDEVSDIIEFALEQQG